LGAGLTATLVACFGGNFLEDFGADFAASVFALFAFRGGGDFLTGNGFLESFAGVFLAPSGCDPLGDFAEFPEGFRDGEGLEIFFNGSLVWPNAGARKDR